MDEARERRVWIFGDCELDEALYEVRRGGRRVAMEPKVFDVLLHLLRHRDRVLSKGELLDALWPSETVSESVLPRCVAAARRAVGDDRSRQAVVKTAHGRGYRFVADVSERLESGHDSEGVAAPSVSEELPLLGREALLERMCGALESARAGRGRAVFAVGEPGIGKTRAVEALEPHAMAAGFAWVRGRAVEDASAPAYRPWVQALRALANGLEPRVREECLAGGAPELVALVPELGGGGRGPAVADQAARYRLFDAVEEFLRRAARVQPLVLFLDDLHWADADSLQLAEHLVPGLRRQPILFVGAYRDVDVRRSHPLAALLGALAREEHCAREPLGGLAPAEVTALVEAIAGAPASAAVGEAVAELTAGNPFFVQEMAQLLGEEGRLGAGALGLSWTLPQGVRDAVGRRLDSLSPECTGVLHAAAVFGDEVPIAHLAGLVDAKGEDLLELLGEALAARLLEEAPGLGAVRFRHALIRRTLQEELGVARRIALHRRAAAVLEAAYGGRVGEHAAELAHHWFEAAAGGDPEPAIAWSGRAAEQALSSHAYEEAARHLERALEALELVVPAPESRRAETLLALGAARSANGQRDAAREAHRRAAAIGRALGQPRVFGRAAVGFAGVAEMGAPPDAEKLGLLEEALDVLGDSHPAERARVLARLTGIDDYAETRARKLALSQEALTLARRSGDAEALGDALNARSWAELGPEGLDARGQVAEEIETLARERGDLRGEILACEARMNVNLWRGEMAAARAESELYLEHANALRQPPLQFLGLACQGTIAMSCGDFADAEARLRAARELGADVLPYADFLADALLVWMKGMRGDASGYLAVGAELGDTARQFFPALRRVAGAGVANAALLLGDRERAEASYAEIMGADIEGWDRDEHWLFAVGQICELAVGLGDAEGCARLADAVRPYAALTVCQDQMRAVTRSVASLLGDLEACAGRGDLAREHYEAALAFEQRAGLRPCLLLTRARYARLLATGDAADRRRAVGLEQAAAALASEIGSRRLEWPMG